MVLEKKTSQPLGKNNIRTTLFDTLFDVLKDFATNPNLHNYNA